MTLTIDCLSWGMLINLIPILIAIVQFIFWLVFRNHDPFLKIYTFISLFTVIVIWIIFQLGTGNNQMIGILMVFILTAIGAIISILWRKIAITRYINIGDEKFRPTGFDEKDSEFLPYVILLGPVFVMIPVMISLYTQKPENIINQQPLLIYYGVLLGVLITCRLIWEWVEAQGISQYMQKYQSD